MISIFYKDKELLINKHFAKSKGLVNGQKIYDVDQFITIFKAHNRFQIAHNAELMKRNGQKE